MQNYWLNFVNHLDPNGKSSNEGKKKNETRWESYEGGKNMVFLNKGSRMVEDEYREEGIEWLIKMGLGKVSPRFSRRGRGVAVTDEEGSCR